MRIVEIDFPGSLFPNGSKLYSAMKGIQRILVIRENKNQNLKLDGCGLTGAKFHLLYRSIWMTRLT